MCGQTDNEIHNAFRMGQDDYSKTLTSAYDLAINWKGDTGSVAITPNYGVAFINDDRGKYSNVHTTDGSVILTMFGDPVECHICGLNQYTNKCPSR